jgi:hypothetical protein
MKNHQSAASVEFYFPKIICSFSFSGYVTVA